MRRFALAAAFCTLAVPVMAQECSVAPEDFSALSQAGGVVAVAASERTDADSGETVRRVTLAFADGTTAIVEDKSCLTRTLGLTLLLPGAPDVDAAAEKLADLLGRTATWQGDFGGDAGVAAAAAVEAAVGSETPVGVPDVSAPAAASDVVASYQRTNSDIVPFEGILALSLSVGGEP